MSTFSLYFVAVYSLAVFCQIECILTKREYEEWQCSRICTDQKLRGMVKRTCYKLSQALAIKEAYSEEDIMNKSGCEKQRSVRLIDEQYEERTVVAPWKEVGMCYLGKGTTRCITMGQKDTNKLLIYSYSGKGCELVESDTDYEIAVLDVEPKVDEENPESSKAGYLDMITDLLKAVKLL